MNNGNQDENIFRITCIMLDMKMPGKSGMELLPELRSAFPDTAVIMATAVGLKPTFAIQCMKLGATIILPKPV